MLLHLDISMSIANFTKRVWLLSAVAVPACCLILHGEQPVLEQSVLETAASLRDTALKSSLAYELLESLTTEVGPRLAGTAKERQAIQWTEKQLKLLGFDKVWTEPVMVRRWERLVERAEVLSPFPQPLIITALGGSVSTEPGGVTSQVVQFATLAELQAADPAKVQGAIVFISNRMERDKEGAGYFPAVRARGEGASVAAGKGAVALLIRSIGTDNHRVPHTGGLRYDESKAKIPAAALSNPDADQLERICKRGQPVRIHLEILTKDFGEVESANVIGEITGREHPQDLVLIGGHIDSWDLGTGAIDDGAGVALTLSAARLIKANAPQPPRRTIRVVAFAAEEPGLIGAKAYAVAHKAEVDQHLIGAESDFGADRVWALAATVKEDALPVIDAMAQLLKPLGVVRHAGRADGGPDVSMMARLGMPAVDLMQDGTRYFDLHHTADDTLDKVDPEALQQNLAAWVVFTYLAAEWPGRFK